MIVPRESISLSILNHSKNSNSYPENSDKAKPDFRSYIIVQKTNELFLLIGEKKSQNINEKWLVSHLNKLKFALKKQIFSYAFNNQSNFATHLFLSNVIAGSIQKNKSLENLNDSVINSIKKIKLYTKNTDEFNEKYNFLNLSNFDKQLLTISHQNILELKKNILNQSEKKYYIPEIVRKIQKCCKTLSLKEKLNNEDHSTMIEKMIQIEKLIKILYLSHQLVNKRLLFFYNNYNSHIKYLNEIKCLQETNKLIANFHESLNRLKIIFKNALDHSMST